MRTVREKGVVFGVTYNYTGYPLVREARDMVARGDLGTIRKVIVEYSQGWLATLLERSGHKQADWRTDPARSGAAGAMGDIGSHAENLATTILGRPITHICADLATVVEGRRLDDDGNLLLRFDGGIRGVLIASQISVGHENEVGIRIFGDRGGLRWRQEDPNTMLYSPLGEPTRILSRGNEYLGPAAQKASRTPPGHPEGYLEAFANVYLGIFEAIRARREGRELGPLEGDFPRVEDGARGVRFIEAVVEAGKRDAKWYELPA